MIDWQYMCMTDYMCADVAGNLSFLIKEELL